MSIGICVLLLNKNADTYIGTSSFNSSFVCGSQIVFGDAVQIIVFRQITCPTLKWSNINRRSVHYPALIFCWVAQRKLWLIGVNIYLHHQRFIVRLLLQLVYGIGNKLFVLL